MPLLEVKNLRKHFPIQKGPFARQIGQVKAVDGVSFALEQGETLGLVGESGCGKTTTGRCILRLLEPTEGEVQFEGQLLGKLTASQMRAFRRKMQIIFQDPYSSLNPRMTVGSMLEEVLKVHHLASGVGIKNRVEELLNLVGLASYHARRYPHEFSGGQRQRVGIARALAVSPKFIVCDEPVSALDVSIQAQIINLLQDLQREFHLTYLFIAHDLSVVRHVSNRVAVMYLGKIVELTDSDQLYRHPRHPYTQALLSSIPLADPFAKKERIILTGDVPSPADPPDGCAFHPRCPLAKHECKTVSPQLQPTAEGGWVSCHLADLT